jgi:hypothetical protein
MTRLTEMAIGVALARAIDDLEEGRWVTGGTIGYVRTSGDHEVDLGPVTVPSANGPVAPFPWNPSGSSKAGKARPEPSTGSSDAASSPYRTSSPVTARPMITRWISEVPSKIVKIFASRCQRSTG